MGIIAKHSLKQKPVNMFYFRIIMGMVGIWILFIASAQLVNYGLKVFINLFKKQP